MFVILVKRTACEGNVCFGPSLSVYSLQPANHRRDGNSYSFSAGSKDTQMDLENGKETLALVTL